MDIAGELLLYIISILGGFSILIWSADIFILGATVLAMYTHVPPLIIGIVIVGFATSAPEYVVSLLGVINNSSGLSLGNILGSNIANISIGLGLPALFYSITIPQSIRKKDLPLLILATISPLLLIYDGVLSRIDAVLLILLFCASIGTSLYTAYKKPHTYTEEKPQLTLRKSLVYILFGLLALVISSQILVYGASNLANVLGISDVVIGLTIVALGTSLPEIAASSLAIMRGESDLALGNIIGSNLFNILFVLGSIGILQPPSIPYTLLIRDGGTVLGITLLLYLFSFGRPPQIQRYKGLIFILAYIIYLSLLIITENSTI